MNPEIKHLRVHSKAYKALQDYKLFKLLYKANKGKGRKEWGMEKRRTGREWKKKTEKKRGEKR